MTLKEIAIELLEKYEASENVAICEYSTNINKDMDLLEKEVKKYRRMIENADRKTEQTDCNGCKFVGTYDTEFPCANCSRKTKDYYAKDEPQTERSE